MICRHGEPFTTTSGGGGATAHGRKSTTPCGLGCGEPRVANLNARVIEKNLERLPSRAPLATLIHKVGCGAGPRSTSSSQMISDCSEISRASPEIRPPAYLITSRPAVEAVSSDSATDTRATLRRSKRSGSSQIVDAGLCGPFPRASGPDRGAIILREIEPVDLFAKLHQYAIIRPALIAVSQQKSEIPPNTANVFCSRDDRVRVRCLPASD